MYSPLSRMEGDFGVFGRMCGGEEHTVLSFSMVSKDSCADESIWTKSWRIKDRYKDFQEVMQIMLGMIVLGLWTMCTQSDEEEFVR